MKRLHIQIFLLLIFSQITYPYVSNDTLAPDFNLMDSNGSEVSLSSFKEKVVVLEWTNHGCPFVAKHYKTMNMQLSGSICLEPVSTTTIFVSKCAPLVSTQPQQPQT